jgi:Zn-dependent M16 (insulinase) family peptidase
MVLAQSTFEVPQIGDKISGFIVKETTYDQSTKSDKILLEHENTSAKMLIINNSDINRGFSIKFNTPPDSRGTNHILEHSVLGGSEKYPTKNSIFDIINTTYVSFANALTYPNMTMYPICSQSEKQLLKSADVYLDAVFNPLILSDERIFEREGWRYELADEASPLNFNGIVYNEIQGNLGNITSTAVSNANRAVFSDTDQGNNSGGIPSEILTLSYEDLLDTYNEYYHPSNCFMVLYGDVDYVEFLDMIDKDYLSSFTKKTIDIERKTQGQFDKLVEKTYTFPVAEGTDTKNKSVIDLVFAVDDIKEMGMEGYMSLNLAVALMNLESSDLKKAMIESQIAESYLMQLDLTTFQPTVHFIAMNANPNKAKDFYDLVMAKMNDAVKKGLDTNLVKSSLRSMEFEEAIGSGSAVNELLLSSLFDNILDNPMEDYLSYIKIIADKLDEKVLESTIKEQLLNNKTVALTVTEPEAGLLEKNQMALYQKLSEKKSSMSKADIEALVKKSADFNAWNNESTSEEVLKSLRAVELKDISIEMKNREINEDTIDGVKLMSTIADVDEISNIQLNFDLSCLTMEELSYLKFYIDMINYGMDTKNRTEMQVMNDTTYLLYGMSSAIEAVSDNEEDTDAHPILKVNYYSFKDEYRKTFDLVYDILLQSDIDKISTYGKRTIANIKANYELQFSEPIGLAQYRGLAYTSAKYQIINYLNGLDYYNFIESLGNKITSNPADVIFNLKVIRAKVFNKPNMQVLYAGDSEALDKFKATMPDFADKLSGLSFSDKEYILPRPAKREALIINSPVQYLVVNASLTENEVPMSHKGIVISTVLNNLLLTPEIRLRGGAYGVGATFMDNNYLVYTYRDSNFMNSLNVIAASGEFLNTIIPYMTDEMVESYVMSLFGSVNQSSGEINDAMEVLIDNYNGTSIQDRIDMLEEIKSTRVLDFGEYANYMTKLNENLNYIVIASPSEIEKNKDLFDDVISLD